MQKNFTKFANQKSININTKQMELSGFNFAKKLGLKEIRGPTKIVDDKSKFTNHIAIKMEDMKKNYGSYPSGIYF